MPPTKQSEKFGKFIRARRNELGISLRELEKQVEGADRPYLSRLERGEYRSPSPVMLASLARALDLPLADLYEMVGYPVSQELPSLPVYLRTQAGLPAKRIAEVQAYIERIQAEARPKRKGGSDGKRAR